MTVPCTVPTSQLQLGSWDLLDPASPVVLATGWDRGAPVPTTSQIQASVLDGAAVVGVGAGNRSPSIPVTVHGTSRLDVAQIVNQLLTYVGQQTWTITFTPAGGFPVVFDCYRASWQVTSGIRQEDQAFAQSLTVTCSALPYGRSPNPVTIPLAGSPLVLDAFDDPPAPPAPTAPTVTATSGTINSSGYVTTPTPSAGSRCFIVTFTPASGMAGDVRRYTIDFTLTRTGLTVDPLADRSGVKLWLRADGQVAFTWQATFVLTLDDGTERTATSTITIPVGAWWRFPFSWEDQAVVPAAARITGWTLRLSTARLGSWGGYSAAGPTYVEFDDLEIYQAATSGVSDDQGSTVHLNGVQGTARAPLTLALDQVAGGTFKSWCVHAPPADGLGAQSLIPLVAGGGTYTTGGQVRYRGTYDVWAAVYSVAGGANRTVSAVISQTPGGSVTVSTVTSLGPGKYLLYLGSVVLPLVDYPMEASATTTVAASSTGGDTMLDVLLLDTRGQTVMVDQSTGARARVWVDEPDPTVALGGVWSGTAADRSDAASVAASLIRAGVVFANPGDSTLLLYSPEGALEGSATYYPRWQQDATS